MSEALCLLDGGYDVLSCTHGYNAEVSQCGGLYCGGLHCGGLFDRVVFSTEWSSRLA